MSFKARFYSFIYAENIDDHEHILVSFIPFANLLHVNQICWQNFISIVDNHAYWFVVVLSFVLSRYKELIKLSLKKKCKSQTEGLKAGFHLTESDAEQKFCLWLCPLQFSIPCSFGNPKGKPKCPTSWSFLHDIDSAYHSYLREKQPQTIFLSCGYQWRKGKLIANNKVNVFHNV